MRDDERNTDAAETSPAARHDSQSGLDAELRREVKEGADAIGDVRENRNLSGSSTWETLPHDSRSDGGADRPEVF